MSEYLFLKLLIEKTPGNNQAKNDYKGHQYAFSRRGLIVPTLFVLTDYYNETFSSNSEADVPELQESIK